MINYIQSEFIKFISFKGALFGFLSAIFLPVALLIFAIIGNKEASSAHLLGISLHCLYLGQLAIISSTASYVGQEYLNSALRTTLLSTPQRFKLIVAKQSLLFFVSSSSAILSGLFCLIVLGLNFPAIGTVSILLSNYSKYMIPIVCSWSMLGVFAGNLVLITKSFICPIALFFPLILGANKMLLSFSESMRFLPDLATMNLFQVESQALYLEPAFGLFVQGLWGVIGLSLAIFLFKKRTVR
ncbi:hypothetical protein IGI37_002585 [Enterococcus sp. AZ194]|uniref:ABC transporter permease n=1 Tax=Enterococcus sp. AZ194 TaxID=2774629 RepID=UPI003F270CFC